MDSYDIFKQLTRGARFYGKRKLEKRPAKVFEDSLEFKEEENEIAIKTEDEDEEYADLNQSSYVSDASEFDSSNIEIKEEIKSEEESEPDDDNEMELLKDFGGGSKKKRKKDSKELNEEKLRKIEVEKVNQFRNVHHIHVNGKSPPDPIKDFDELSDLKVSNLIVNNLRKSGYTEPTPIQMQTIPIMAEGRSMLGCAPTGSGKTAAFLVPILRDLKGPQKKGFRALILCPTRELAKQTQRECVRLSEGIDFRIHIISKVNQAEMKYGAKSSKKYDILITTPNRICYLLGKEGNVLDLSNIEWLVLDEADKLFEESSNSFREQFNEIFNACTSTMKKVALFSATHTHPVAQWARQNLKGLLTVTIGQRNTATDLIDQELLFVGSESGKLLAIRDLVRKGLQPPVLVFVQSKSRARQLYNELLYDGINVDVIHADRTQQQRDNVVRAFREGKIWVLICTELMGRGIDFKSVNLVINYDFPPSTISYIHRIGRTGRAGRRGRAITFFTQDDTVNLRGVANIMKNSGCPVPEFMLAMRKIKKSDRKKMERSAQWREDIKTLPRFEAKRRQQKGRMLKTKQKNEVVEQWLVESEEKKDRSSGKTLAKNKEKKGKGKVK